MADDKSIRFEVAQGAGKHLLRYVWDCLLYLLEAHGLFCRFESKEHKDAPAVAYTGNDVTDRTVWEMQVSDSVFYLHRSIDF